MHHDALPGCEGVLQLSESFTTLLTLRYAAVRCGNRGRRARLRRRQRCGALQRCRIERWLPLLSRSNVRPGGPSGDFERGWFLNAAARSRSVT